MAELLLKQLVDAAAQNVEKGEFVTTGFVGSIVIISPHGRP